MIALYYLGSVDALKLLLKMYLGKYPNGIEHALKSWPMIIFDDVLKEQITVALMEIELMKNDLL
jgi:hypothetical protein